MSLDEMDRDMVRAAIAAEDGKFCQHHGFDWDAIQDAAKRNASGGRIRGGSTISQQTAKNVFLWQGRSYFRKGLEAWFTVLIETFWGKKRIMEVYLNSIEYGPGIYGAEAASRTYFKVGADRLTQQQSSRLAAILPSPLKWKAVNPGRYVKKRSSRIGKASGAVRRDGLAACVA
jgi:monofunctional biosynthetic peptidoglycan transglycosylase